MRNATSTYRFLLAALLLGFSVLAARGSCAMACAAAPVERIVQHASGDRESVRGADQQHLVAALQRSLPPFITEGGGSTGGHAGFGRDTGCLPLPGFAAVSCAKARLKQRRSELLEHYTFQQHLSLYPKHGFW